MLAGSGHRIDEVCHSDTTGTLLNCDPCLRQAACLVADAHPRGVETLGGWAREGLAMIVTSRSTEKFGQGQRLPTRSKFFSSQSSALFLPSSCNALMKVDSLLALLSELNWLINSGESIKCK